MDLKRRLSIYDIEQIFWAIQAKLCDSTEDPIQKIKDYIITEDITNANDIYNNLVCFYKAM